VVVVVSWSWCCGCCYLTQMAQAPVYHQKLRTMRTQMVEISTRVQRLKARSAKLKQRKIGAEEKERELTAQPAASLLMRRAGSALPRSPSTKGKERT